MDWVDSSWCTILTHSKGTVPLNSSEMAARRNRRDAVTDAEIAAYQEANHRFGNDNVRIAAHMAQREVLTEHARNIYAGPVRGVANRLRVVRRHIQRRQLVNGHLPEDPNRRDDRFAFNLEGLVDPRELQDNMNNAAEREAADPLANEGEANNPEDGGVAQNNQAEGGDGAGFEDNVNELNQLPRGGLRQLQVQNQVLLQRILTRLEARQDQQDHLTRLLINRLEPADPNNGAN
ncbi:uncharacterized protein LOC135499150 [Lineus longissimus]|uniref:uncharacterized protein LOC135496348 n=1 Tax=Lineus longissimus TaxID=88925 RepID=UPI00315C64A8